MPRKLTYTRTLAPNSPLITARGYGCREVYPQDSSYECWYPGVTSSPFPAYTPVNEGKGTQGHVPPKKVQFSVGAFFFRRGGLRSVPGLKFTLPSLRSSGAQHAARRAPTRKINTRFSSIAAIPRPFYLYQLCALAGNRNGSGVARFRAGACWALQELGELEANIVGVRNGG